MKSLLTAVFLIVAALPALAQSYEGTVTYQKKDERAIITEYPYPASVVEDAIVDKFEKMGFKNKDSKGFLLYKNIVLTEVSSDPADYLIRVDRKNRKDKDQSLVYMIVQKNEQNVISSDESITENGKQFLDHLAPDLDAFNLEVQITDQEAAVTKAQKKLKNLQDDQESMEKKIKKLQSDLEANAKDQENQQKEIDKQKQILDSIKGRRKVG
ncbi:MAG TPA: hypothetical protein VGC95_07885 [Chitinophagaceae bacterium]|jgi:hypothetical protein